jgi:hypothetical protein
MSENLTTRFVVSSTQHRALGKLICVQLAPDHWLRFTAVEASSLSLALVAVRNGISPEREIYMSPIASDAAFVGSVTATGMDILVPEGVKTLGWEEVSVLAQDLALAIG